MVKQMDCTLMWKVLLKKKAGNINKLLCQWRRSSAFIVNFEHVIAGWNPVVPDEQLVIMLSRRYERTAKDSSGKFLYITVTNHLRRKFYCINKNCLLRRYPCFWRSMFLVKDATKHRLSSAHKLFHRRKRHFN